VLNLRTHESLRWNTLILHLPSKGNCGWFFTKSLLELRQHGQRSHHLLFQMSLLLSCHFRNWSCITWPWVLIQRCHHTKLQWKLRIQVQITILYLQQHALSRVVGKQITFYGLLQESATCGPHVANATILCGPSHGFGVSQQKFCMRGPIMLKSW